jgi:hypothetical protein
MLVQRILNTENDVQWYKVKKNALKTLTLSEAQYYIEMAILPRLKKNT